MIIDKSQIFNIVKEILSKPSDLIIPRKRIRCNNRSTSVVNEDKEGWDKGPNLLPGSELELEIKEHCLEKWVLKNSASALKSLTYLLLSNKRDLLLVLFYQHKKILG